MTLAVTDRHGGTSAVPYDTLDLGGRVGDDPAAVAVNRARVAAALGLAAPDRLLLVDQVHGTEVVVVDRPWPSGPVPRADALVTATAGLAVAVLVADCTPVLAADPAAGVVGVAHAGRAGMAAGVVPALLDAMAGLGATAPVVRVGPGICGRCYEVPAALRAEVAAVVPEAASTTRAGTAALDVGAGVLAQARGRAADVRHLGGCAYEDADLYSYRRAGGAAGRTGRFAGVAVLRER